MTLQVPTVLIMTSVPATTQTPGVVDVYSTVKPEVAVASGFIGKEPPWT